MANEITFTDLIASSIHDMKNSLNMQISALEQMAQTAQQSHDQSALENLERMLYQAKRMDSSLIQLLSLYKLGNAIYPLDMGEHSVADLLQEACLQNQSIMVYKHVAVEIDCPDDCYWFFDRDLVFGVVINALNNAYQYTHDKIRLAAVAGPAGLELRIEDNGPGYPEHMLQEGGVDAKKGISFESGSTGLGFYFSAQVAALHKNGDRVGSLFIENGGAYGGGCFVVRLP